MIVLSGADLVLPDRILTSGTLAIDKDRIVDIRNDAPGTLHGHYIVPGFIDVHVHGVGGVDVLDGADAVGAVAALLPRYGVTAFCPTSMATTPSRLRTLLSAVRNEREAGTRRGARVLPAHLESNFVSADYRGAQPAACLRVPREAFPRRSGDVGRVEPSDDFTAVEILDEIERAAPDVGIVTLAPELDGGLDLIAWLTARGHRASLGHSGASYEIAQAAITAGARQATHLFNRMPAFNHRMPGLVGAILQSDDIAAELICDGFHLHPAVVRTAIAAKRPSRVMAITDATAAAGLAPGSRTRLGGQTVTARESAAFLDDGTIAGGVATMDRVFRTLVGSVGLSLIDAVSLCATTAARELGLVGHGLLAIDATADLTVLDDQFTVVQTYVGGELVYSRAS